MKFILGKKIAMSQKFNATGQVIPVTIIKAGPCFISQIKNNDKDGYQALQLSFENKNKLNKPQNGHLKNMAPARYLREFKLDSEKVEFQKGQEITVAIFSPGEKVNVIANSKGKGFQGVVKRHGFAGAPKTHGNKDQLRHGGSIGAQRPQRVLKNKKMAGRMGNNQVTVKNLEIVEIDDKNNLLYLKGAVPGSRNALVKIIAPGEMKLTEASKLAKQVKQEEIKNEQSLTTEIPSVIATENKGNKVVEQK